MNKQPIPAIAIFTRSLGIFPLAALVLLASLASSASASVIFHDDFSGTSTNINDYGYYLAADHSTGTIFDNNGDRGIRLTGNAAAADGDVIFKQFAPVTLADGESLRLTSTIVGSNSGGINTQVSFLLANTSNTFTSNQGKNVWDAPLQRYGIRIRSSSEGNSGLLDASQTIGEDLPLLFGSSFATINPGPFVPNQAEQETVVVLEIQRVSASETRFFVSLGEDVLFNWVDGAGFDLHTFDTMAFGLRVGADNRFLELDEVRLELIPEPSAVGLLLAALGFVILYRRRTRGPRAS